MAKISEKLANNEKYPDLIFPSIRLRARRAGEAIEVFDTVRGAWVVLTPEEWVRQHVLSWLIRQRGFVPQLLVEEYAVSLNGQPQRADIVAINRTLAPTLLVECKATDVVLDEAVFSQAVRYNSVVRAPMIMLTNGLENRFYSTADFVHYAAQQSLDVASV